MHSIARVAHGLCLGLWFGSSAFFTLIAAPVIFQSFDRAVRNPPADRPAFLAMELTKENGSQLAGMAVGPIFPWYFLLQGCCAVVCLATSLSWNRQLPSAKIHRVRLWLLILAFLTVLIGWPLSNYVSELRMARFSTDLAVAAAAKAAFARWHLVSLLLNFVSLGLVGGALSLVGWLPPTPGAGSNQAARPS